jgi:hypothetical protein
MGSWAFFALGQRQARFGIDARDGHVGLQRLRRIGQHADQVRQKAVVGDGLVDEWAAAFGCGFLGVQGQTGHGGSLG